MALQRLSIELQDLGRARQIADLLGEIGDPAASATSIFEVPATCGWRVDAYYEAVPEVELLSAALGQQFGEPLTLALEAVPDENWVAISQAALPPVTAGRFLVHGSHDRDRVGRRLNAIEIDAGEAFGTAHHATTEGCLEALDRLARTSRPRRVLDLGCGSGVLAIAAVRALPGAAVIASDIDPLAVAVARGNLTANRAHTRVKAVRAANLAHPALKAGGPYDLVLANILAGPLIQLAPGLRSAIRPGGRVVLSGILDEQAREVAAIYAATGFRLETRRILKGWATLVMRRASRR